MAAAEPEIPLHSEYPARSGARRRPTRSKQLARVRDPVATAPAMDHWRETLLEYKRRKAASLSAGAPTSAMALASVPGSRNWNPLGPSVVLNGQTVGSQPVGGRVAGLAIAPGGTVIYAATANGGVFRSDDGATSWRSLMDRFDLDPTSFASASLICGAIALAPSRPQRVYVGTGEGDTQALFQLRITNALPAYRGVGPVSSDDGGSTWTPETSTPNLAGAAFFSIAVNAADPDIAVAGTTLGLYRRTKNAAGQAEWVQVKPGLFPSVAFVANGPLHRFYAAQWDDTGALAGVSHSDDDGATWVAAGINFPKAGAGQIALAAQPANTDVVYAYIAKTNGALDGVYRLDNAAASWSQISNPPDVLPGSQGQYDLTIAVHPTDINVVYLGGDRMTTPPWGGSIWRCPVTRTGASYQFNGVASIGTHAHGDVHFLTHTPGDPTELWAATDGGVFLNRDPTKSGEFAGQNNGLACLCSNFLAQHPTDPNILLVGLQDNGTARTSSGPIWTHVGSGDGGYCLFNWANPDLALSFANGVVYRASDGGVSEASWTPTWDDGWATMTQPIVGPAYDPANPGNADLVALGAGPQIYISDDFGSTWPTIVDLSASGAGGSVFVMCWGNPDRVFAATTTGDVFRLDKGGASWAVTRLDNAAAGPLGLTQLHYRHRYRLGRRQPKLRICEFRRDRRSPQDLALRWHPMVGSQRIDWPLGPPRHRTQRHRGRQIGTSEHLRWR